MNELISRSEVEQKMAETIARMMVTKRWMRCDQDNEDEILKVIRDAPTIEAEPVRHGMWVWHEDWGHSSISEPPELLDAYWICSACGTDLLQYLKSHFPGIPTYTECSEEVPTLERCPNCGAKMDGGAEE